MNNLDLNAIAHVIALRQGWDDARRTRVLSEYKSFLARASRRSNGDPLRPSREVDELWHAHMLHSEMYLEDCTRWFGAFVHHRPHLKKAEAALLISLDLIPKNFIGPDEDACQADCQAPDCSDKPQPLEVHGFDCSSAERPPKPAPPAPLPNDAVDCSAPNEPPGPPPGTIGFELDHADCTAKGPEPGGIDTGERPRRAPAAA